MAGLSQTTNSSLGSSFSSGSSLNKQDLQTSKGLYDLSVQSGLGKEADRIIATHSGEENKKIFSGGFISDVFDVLNSLQYGITGVLKGKGFLEGVKTRQSFSDKDALGDNGLPGVIAGVVMDIAVDPLTYIAPWTILKKIPAVSKLAKISSVKIFGKSVEKIVDVTDKSGKIVQKVIPQWEEGTKVGSWLAEKFAWRLGKDPTYVNALENQINGIGVSIGMIKELVAPMIKLTPDTAKKILTKDTTGRVKRVLLKDLKKILSPEEFEIVAPIWKKVDEMGKELVDLGVLGKTKFEENIGEYLKNAYLEYETAQNKGFLSSNLSFVCENSRREKL